MNTNKTQSSFSAGIISEELFSRLDFNKINSGLKQCENFITRIAGGVKYRTGTKFISEVKYSNKNTRLIPYSLKTGLGFCLEFGDKYIRFIKDGEYILNGGVPYEVVTTYSEADLDKIKYISSSKGLFLVHNKYKPMVLKRIADNNWSLVELKFNPDVLQPKSVMIAQQGYLSNDQTAYPRVDFNGWKYAVSFTDKEGHEGLAVETDEFTNDISIALQPMNVAVECPISDDKWNTIDKINFYRSNKGELVFLYSVSASDVKSSISNFATSTNNGSAGRWQKRTSTGTVTSGSGSSYTFPAFNGFVLSDINLQTDSSKQTKNEFEGFSANDYPSAIAIWNQRLILGGTVSKPTTLWFSRIGDYEDFTNTYLQAANESMELTLNSIDLDVINDLVPFDDLFIFTETKVWRVVGSSATNMSAYIESYSGTAGLSPYCSKKSVLYIESSNNAVYNFAYVNEEGGYTGRNLTLLCRDLFDGYVLKDISFKNTPMPILYSVRNDGKLVEMTYEREENIYGWHLHSTQGKFLKVCCIDEIIEDEVYVIVERQGKKYVEIFQKEILSGEGINESWHLDCATRVISGTNIYAWVNEDIVLYTENLTPSVGDHVITAEYDEGDQITAYDNINNTITVDNVVYVRDSSKDMPDQSVNQISGLSRFAGQKVNVMADGNFYENMEVSNSGTLVLGFQAANVLVGLSYRGIIETLPYEYQEEDGSYSVGKNRRQVSILINCKDTRGLCYGTNINKLNMIKPYTQLNYGRNIPLETEIYHEPLSDNYDIQKTVFIIQDTPFPVFIRNITLEIKYGEKN